MRLAIKIVLWIIDTIIFSTTFTLVKTNFAEKYTKWVIQKMYDEMNEDARRR